MYRPEASPFVPFGVFCAFPTAALQPAQACSTPRMGFNPLDGSPFNLQVLNVPPLLQASLFTCECLQCPTNLLNVLQPLHAEPLHPHAQSHPYANNVPYAPFEETPLQLIQGNVQSTPMSPLPFPHNINLLSPNVECMQPILPQDVPRDVHAPYEETLLQLLQIHGNVDSAAIYPQAYPSNVNSFPSNVQCEQPSLPQDMSRNAQHSAEALLADSHMNIHQNQTHFNLPYTPRNQRRFSVSDVPEAGERTTRRRRLVSEPVEIEIPEWMSFFLQNSSSDIQTFASPDLTEWGVKHPRGTIFQSKHYMICCLTLDSGIECYARLTPSQIKFSSNINGISYVLDEAGVRTCWGSYISAGGIMELWEDTMHKTLVWKPTTGTSSGSSLCFQKEGFNYYSATPELKNIRISVKDSSIHAKSGQRRPDKPDFIFLKTYVFRSSECFKQRLYCDGSSLQLTFHTQTACLDSSGQLSLEQ